MQPATAAAILLSFLQMMTKAAQSEVRIVWERKVYLGQQGMLGGRFAGTMEIHRVQFYTH